MPFQIVRNDITKVRADAIVNTANPEPIYASGTDRAIYLAAGAEELLAERQKIGYIQTGEAAVTPAFRLPAKFIIHTVGPAWKGGNYGEFDDLASCYRKSLLLARQLGCGSIAFPLISTGVYGFPKDKALSVATTVIADFLEENEMEVTLVVFNKSAFVLSKDLVDSVSQFIDDRYVDAAQAKEYGEDYAAGSMRAEESLSARRERRRFFQRRPQGDAAKDKEERRPFWRRPREAAQREEADEAEDLREEAAPPSYRPAGGTNRPNWASMPLADAAMPSAAGRSLKDLMRQVGETFQEQLLRLIDERQLTDAEVYKKANLDRKLFSKIRCNPAYNPSKRTVLALAAALQLNLDETRDLLGRAGFALSPGSKSDLILAYCIENRIYDIYKINLLLFEYDQPTL